MVEVQEEPLQILGVGLGLYMVTKDTRGNGMGEAEELPPQ